MALHVIREQLNGFREFIQTQGVMGLAIGFILGGAVTRVVQALVGDIINPLLGLVLGSAAGLKTAKLVFGQTEILWGDFVSVLIDFLVVAFIVYLGVRLLRLEKLDKKREAKK